MAPKRKRTPEPSSHTHNPTSGTAAQLPPQPPHPSVAATRRATRHKLGLPPPPMTITPVPPPQPPGSTLSELQKRGRGRPPAPAATASASALPPALPPVLPPAHATQQPQVPSPRVLRWAPPEILRYPIKTKPAPTTSLATKYSARPSDLVAPEITYHVPQPAHPSQRPSALVRPHGPMAQPPRLDRGPPPPVVTPVYPPKPPGPALERPVRNDRNIDKVVLGRLCFRTWYPSYYGKEVLGDSSGNAKGGSKDGGKDLGGKSSSRRDREHHVMLDRLYVCPSCFKYSKEIVSWWEHVQACEAKGFMPGRKIYVHPRGRRKVLVPQDYRGPGPKKRRGSGGGRYVEEIVQDEGEWSIWEVDGETDGLFCQNLSLFAKLFLDNKSVFFDVTGFNYFLLAYTPPTRPAIGDAEVRAPASQIVGFFSKEKMSWDNNNLACILVFPPWQRKGLGALLMGASYEISRREGILGGPEKPISDLGKKGYKRFWTGEIARWLLSLDVDANTDADADANADANSNAGSELLVDVGDCSRATWISPDDCLQVLRDMRIVQEAGMGPGKPKERPREKQKKEDDAVAEEKDEKSNVGQTQTQAQAQAQAQPQEMEKEVIKMVPRMRVDKQAVRAYVAEHRISLERVCDPAGFVEGYAIKTPAAEEEEEE